MIDEFATAAERAEYIKFNRDCRCQLEALWMIDHPKDGVRKIAREFGDVSKSQVHRDLQRLKDIDYSLFLQCRQIMYKHKRKYRR